MKVFIYTLYPFILVSCCLANRKCKGDDFSARFRIVSLSTGKDLVFGSAKVYNKDSIKFYSVNGSDTIHHPFGAGPNPNPGEDSLLFVNFDYQKNENVFVQLTNTDIDTMTLSYQSTDGSQCCPDYTIVLVNSYNNKMPEAAPGGIILVRK